MTEHDQSDQRISPVEIVEAVKRGSIYLGYWVFVLGLAYTASPAGVAHWAFWAVGLVGVLVAGVWTLRDGAPEPTPPPPPSGPFVPGERRPVDTTHYRSGAVSAGGGTRYLQPPDPPQLMK